MKFRPALWAALVCAVSIGTSAQSDAVILSQSNAPNIDLSSHVRSMLGAERAAMDAVSAQRVKRLVTQPTRTNLWSKKPEPKPALRYDVAYLDTLPSVTRGEPWRCLTEALYFEARGETVKGIFAVGEVILNRVESTFYPDDLCSVIYQGTGQRYRCQFTYSCDGKKEIVNEPRAWERVGKVADLLMRGTAPRDLTEGATHYHTKAVRPRWSRVFTRTATIGYHHFYRQEPRYASN